MNDSPNGNSSTTTLADLCPPEARRKIAGFVRGTSEETSDQLPRGILWKMVSRRVNSRIDKALDTPVEQILERAWESLKRLRKLRELKALPSFDVDLLEHTIRSLNQPTLEVEIDDHHIGKLEFSFEIIVQVGGVRLLGKNGYIERALPRACTVAGNFSCKTTVWGIKQELPPARIDPIQLPLPDEGVCFARPIPIP